MRRPLPARPVQPGPPFDAPAARRLRAALGMGPEHVAYGMRASFGLPHVTPDLVMAWERGLASPSGPELTALAAVLWCSPGDLAGRPRTLREHRIARGLAPEDVAGTVGLELLAYLHMEEHDAWRGTDRQSAALAGLLELSLADFISVTGRAGKLADLLRRAVTTRWQACVRPVSRIVPLDRRLLGAALHGLHQEYQRQGGDGRDFLDRIVEHFWSRVEDSPQDP
ncbi:XRE family transcriptional regulator [Streptomyces sp. NPDC001348]